MKSPIPDYLKRVLDNARPDDSGVPAGYIDVLAKADTSKLAIAIAMVDGNIYSAGDDDVEFSIQSISEAFVYALAIEDASIYLLKPSIETWHFGTESPYSHSTIQVSKLSSPKIGVEPSGDAFNELSLHEGSNRPMNPMINAGAITAHSLVVRPDATAEERTDRILKVMSKLAGRDSKVCEEVYEAEMKDWDRNMGLAHMLKAAGIVRCDPREVVKGYVRQCSINVTVRDLALMAATLSNAGYHPITGERIFPHASVRQVLSVMTTSKSGVAGGILGALPGQVGLAAFSPKLDDKGNSVRGVAICEQLSRDMGLHMMDVSQIARSTVNTTIATLKTADDHHPNCRRRVAIFNMRGAVRFAGSEILTRALTRELGEADPDDPGSGAYSDACAVVISFRDVFSLNKVARQIVHEDIGRLLADDRSVVIIDPTGVLSWEHDGKDKHPEVVENQDQAREFIGGRGCSASIEQSW